MYTHVRDTHQTYDIKPLQSCTGTLSFQRTFGHTHFIGCLFLSYFYEKSKPKHLPR